MAEGPRRLLQGSGGGAGVRTRRASRERGDDLEEAVVHVKPEQPVLRVEGRDLAAVAGAACLVGDVPRRLSDDLRRGGGGRRGWSCPYGGKRLRLCGRTERPRV